MRTTLTIADDVYEHVRLKAFHERKPLGEVVSDLLRDALANRTMRTARTFGAFEGQIDIPEDFDDELPEITEALEERLEA